MIFNYYLVSCDYIYFHIDLRFWQSYFLEIDFEENLCKSVRFSLIGIYVSSLSRSSHPFLSLSFLFVPTITSQLPYPFLSHTLKMSPVSWQYLPRLRHMFPRQERDVGRQFEFCIKHQCVYFVCLDRAISSLLNTTADFRLCSVECQLFKKKKEPMKCLGDCKWPNS